jgi:hypothetical protein
VGRVGSGQTIHHLRRQQTAGSKSIEKIRRGQERFHVVGFTSWETYTQFPRIIIRLSVASQFRDSAGREKEEEAAVVFLLSVSSFLTFGILLPCRILPGVARGL